MADAITTEAQLTVARPWALPTDDVLAELEAEASGLSSDEAAERLAVVGHNRLPEPARKPAFLRFLAHFNDTLIFILLAAGLIKLLVGDWVDALVILVVAVINATIGHVQEGRAEKALAGIRGMLSAEASSRRDGGWATVASEDLVPGDVVRLAPGDKVPADLRLLQSFQLRIDEAPLTGESDPSSKSVDEVPYDAGVGDRDSMAFSGTIVTAGQGRGVVTATGTATEIGRIQSLSDEAGVLETPLTRQLGGFGRTLTLVILGMAAVMLLIGRFAHGQPLGDVVGAVIAFAVAAIPEGLPALVTITLAIGVQHMARQRAITRKLPAVEALGSVTTVCSDKTGTLTRNEMTVRRIVTPLAHYDVSGLGYQPDGEITPAEGAGASDGADLTAIGSIGNLCNDAHVVATDDGGWNLVGEPTEGALKVAAMKAGIDNAGARRVAVLPFDSAVKLMATLNEGADGSRAILVKGAPDRLLDRSTTQRGAHGPEPLQLARWEAEIATLAGQGLRVLAAARRQAPSGMDDVALEDVQDLEFIGLWGIVDPPRPEAIDAIADCHAAGIRVKMITGDHADTALAISREMGLADADAEVLTGTELEALSQEQLGRVVRDVDVYARTSPEHKIRIVRALQKHGEVVAMTGDGVNDAPALTRADVGIAMGIKGTEATKEAAEIVLADDNFATIRSAIAEGRRIYDNLRKSVIFLLPTNGAQALVLLVAVVFGLALPLTSVQVLWVNMITAVTLSLALAYEPADPGIMRRGPRASGGAIINLRELTFVLLASLLIGGATTAVFQWTAGTGAGLEVARTEAVFTLAFGQLAFLFNCRFLTRSSLTLDVLRGNKAVWWSAGALVALQVLYSYAPFMNALFESRPLNLFSWLLPIVVAVGIFLAVEGLKAIMRAQDRGQADAAR